jgi:glycoside/pentoside/hexuronide:cation symporter, GPH family
MATTAPAAPTLGVRPFGWRDRVAYTVGDVGNNLTFYLQAAFFLVFYTDVMGIHPGHVGTLLFGARILDAFTDIAAGRLIDRLPAGPAGRFRPWLLRCMVPVGVAAALMFTPVLQDAEYAARLAWMIITYVLWGAVFYTLVNIPYGSMVSVISPRPDDRAALSVARSLGGSLGFLALAGLLPSIVFVQVGGRSELSGSRMMVAAAVCGVLAIACYLLCYLGVEERVRTAPRPRQGRMGAGALLTALVTNRALTGIVAVTLCVLVATTMLAAMLPYVYGEHFGDGRLLSLGNVAGIAPVLLFLFLAAGLARRLGKRELGLTGLTVATASGLSLFLLHTDSPLVFTAGYALVMLGCAGFESLVWATISDVIDHHELRTGERPDATVYAIHSWSRKLGQALAGGLSGWALGWIGYEATAGAGTTQAPEVLESLYALATLAPAVLLGLAAVILWLWFPLSKRRVAENSALLMARRG